jgi:hypothetical protein
LYLPLGYMGYIVTVIYTYTYVFVILHEYIVVESLSLR